MNTKFLSFVSLIALIYSFNSFAANTCAYIFEDRQAAFERVLKEDQERAKLLNAIEAERLSDTSNDINGNRLPVLSLREARKNQNNPPEIKLTISIIERMESDGGTHIIENMGYRVGLNSLGQIILTNHFGQTIRLNKFPVNVVRVYRGAENVYVISASNTNFYIVQLGTQDAKGIKVSEAPKELLDMVGLPYYMIGNVTVSKVERMGDDLFYITLIDHRGREVRHRAHFTSEDLAPLMKAANVKIPEELIGYNRTIIAPESFVGTETLISRLSGLDRN
jgi:hypothetical protein